jgi:hypothetical protein
MFRRVDDTPDGAEKKRLLKEINTTPSVDAGRRKRAADMIADIEAKEPPPPVPQPLYFPSPPTTSSPNGSASAKVDPNSVPTGVIPQGLTAEDQQRKVLEPKVFGGKATLEEIRLLKAICSHLGNRDCRDRASAMLKKKQEPPAP